MTARFLTPAERETAALRPMKFQRTTQTKRWDKGQFIEAITDVKSWWFFLFSFVTCIPNGGTTSVRIPMSTWNAWQILTAIAVQHFGHQELRIRQLQDHSHGPSSFRIPTDHRDPGRRLHDHVPQVAPHRPRARLPHGHCRGPDDQAAAHVGEAVAACRILAYHGRGAGLSAHALSVVEQHCRLHEKVDRDGFDLSWVLRRQPQWSSVFYQHRGA